MILEDTCHPQKFSDVPKFIYLLAILSIASLSEITDTKWYLGKGLGYF